MSVDKFGRSSFQFQQKHGFVEVLYEEEEVLNAKRRRIINVEAPTDNNDAAIKLYVDAKVEECLVKCAASVQLDKDNIIEIVNSYKTQGIPFIVETGNPSETVEILVIHVIKNILSKWQK